MENNEINKTIAKYMGWYRQSTDRHPDTWNNAEGFRSELNFTESLDALVPVWEKLDHVSLEMYQQRDGRWGFYFHNSDRITTRGAVYQAAAHATALAIKELEK